MGTKTLSVTDDAYHRLAQLKRPGESFSDVIGRLTGKEDIMRFAGSLSAASAAKLASSSQDFRRRFDADVRRRLH